MPSSPSSRATLPPGDRSAVPSVPGISAWAAVLVAVGATALGIAVDAVRGSELTSIFAVLYVLGCIAAVVAVKHRGLFTAMVQPPLIMFAGVPVAYQLMTTDNSTSVKDIVLNVAIPLVNRFPLMVVATVLTLIVGGIRFYVDRLQDTERAHAGRRSPRRDAAPDDARTSGPAARPGGSRPSPPRTSPARADHSEPPDPHDTADRTRRSPLPHRPNPPRRPPPRTRRHEDEGARGRQPVSDQPVPRYPRPETRPAREPAINPYSDSWGASRESDSDRRRADGPRVPPYPPPRVRYRDRD